MKRRGSILGLVIVLLLWIGSNFENVSAATKEKHVDVLFLHDIHYHLNEFATVEDGEALVLGGFAKLAILIQAQKEENPETLLLDAGDFSRGTLIQVVYEEASELRMLGELGFDATTFGNHEFDYKAEGLANMLKHAAESGDMLPQLVVCNIDWEAMEEVGLLKAAFADFGIKEYTIIEKAGVRITVVGVFGKNSENCVPNCPLIFKDSVEVVRETVSEI